MVPPPSVGAMVRGQSWTGKRLNRHLCLNLPLPFPQDRAGTSVPWSPRQLGHKPQGQSVLLSPAPQEPRKSHRD